MDARTGGGYRLAFANGAEPPIEFFGRYIEVTPHTRLVWTNDEGEEGAITTVTFEDQGDQSLLVMHDRYPSKEALDAGSGSLDAMPETFEQLDELLTQLGASA
jgi:uncharacterized protein YndB with AHSA1/START domain